MLSLPRGIRRSVEAHNSDRPVFYDWLEANTLFAEEELSQTDVVDFLMEQQIYAKQDFCSEFISNAWIQIERRLKWIGRGSPLGFHDRLMVREIDWQATPGQSFCLILSLGPKYDGWFDTFGIDYAEQGSLFESLTSEAMARVFTGWTFTQTAWSRDNTSSLRDVVGTLTAMLGEPLGDIETYASSGAHEAGVDLVWHLPFADQRGGLPVFLAQCASGGNWEDKLDTPNLGQWKRIIHFASEPYKAFSLPFALEDRELRLRSAQIEGLLLDRYRLLMHDTPEAEWLSDELRERLLRWLEPRVQWLIGL